MEGRGRYIMGKIGIVMYHYVRDLKHSRYPGIKGLDYALFKEQIRFFSESFHVITMEQLIEHYISGAELPEDAILLTFDDGYIDNYLYVLPVLKEYHMQGSFFVPGRVFQEHCLLDVNKIHYLLASTPIDLLYKELLGQMDDYRGGEWDYPSNEELFQQYAVATRFDDKETVFVKRILQVALPEELRGIISSNMFAKYVGVSEEVLARELYLNYDQMKEMKRQGMYFGIHGYGHYWRNRLPLGELEADIGKGLDALQGLLPSDSWVINYPYGSYSDEVIDVAKRKGCILGLSTDVRMADIGQDDRFKLPRLDTNDYPPKSKRYLEL